MPSGKHLWLCAQHQSLRRVTVLQDTEPAVAVEDVTKTPEAVLLQSLRSVKDDSSNTQFDGTYASAPTSMLSAVFVV